MQTVTKDELQPQTGVFDHVDPAGDIIISPRVVFTLALHAALSTYGVVGIASRYTGSDCTHSDPRRGLEVHISEGDATSPSQRHVTVNVHIIAEYGMRVRAVTNSLQHQIQYSVERSTGFSVDGVNVHVSGLHVTSED